MADPARSPETGERPIRGRGPATGTPRWVKVTGLLVAVLALLVVVMLLLPGGHGPSRHIPSGHTAPAGGHQ